MHLHPIPRFFVRFLTRGFLVLLFIGLPAVILYLREAGLGYGLKEQVAAALSGEGFTTTIDRLYFDPFNGLVAQNIEITAKTPGGGNLARVERIVVSASLSELLAKKISIDHIQLNDTDVSIPLSKAPDAMRLKLTGVSAQCLFFSDQVRISYFEGTVQGIRVYLSGLLQNPLSFQTKGGAGPVGGQAVHSAVEEWLQRFSEITFTGPSPELRAEVSGDLADPGSVTVSPITLRTGGIVGPNWKIDGLEVEAEFRDGGLSVRKFLARAGGGELNLSADWRDKAVVFEVLSSVGLGPFVGLLPKNSPVHDLKLSGVPMIEASGRVSFESEPVTYNVLGAIRLESFSFRKVAFDGFSTDFAVRDGRFYARGAELTVGESVLKAAVLSEPGNFRARMTNTILPTHFTSLLSPNDQVFLGYMEFKDPPFLELELQGDKPELAAITGHGSMKLGRTAVRKAWMDRIESKIDIADSAFTYRDFTITRGKGKGTGTLVYDVGKHEVRLENVKSTLPPVDVMMWVDPKIADAIRPYRFREPPLVRADGKVHMTDPEKNNLALKISSSEGLDYDLLNRTLKFGRTEADVNIKGKYVLADVKSARLMGGEAGVRAKVSIDDKNPVFSADLDMRRVDFAQLTKLYFDYDDSKGQVSGKFRFSARMKEEEKLRGEGSIRVENGQVFAIPILGPLSDIINKIIPKAGYQTARLATADFTIGDEKIHTDNLEIEGAGFSMFGNGDIFFMRDRMNLSVRINARGIPGLVLFPVSKLFEYVSTGSVSEPEWKPKIIPRFGSGDEKATP